MSQPSRPRRSRRSRAERMSRIEELIRQPWTPSTASVSRWRCWPMLWRAWTRIPRKCCTASTCGAESTNPVEQVIALRAAELEANRAAAQHQLLDDRLENLNSLFGRVGVLPDGRLVTARVGVESPRHVTVVGSTAETEADLIGVLLSAAVSDAEFHESIRRASAGCWFIGVTYLAGSTQVPNVVDHG